MWHVERTIPGVDSERDEVLPFAGPAASLPLWSSFARLPFALARDVWLGLLVLAFAALVAAALLLAGVPLTPAAAGAGLLFAALAGPIIGSIALGQAALVAAAAVALALAGLEGRAPWAIAAAFVAGIQPNLALPLAAGLTNRRTAALLGVAALAFVTVTLAAGGGPAGLAAYAERLVEHGAAERFSAVQYSVPAIAASFGVPDGAATVLGAGIALLALAGAAAAAIRLRARPVLAAAVAIGLLPWIVPFFHEHDFALEVIPVLVLAAAPDGRVRRLAGMATACVLVDWFGIAQRPATTAQAVCLAAALACAFAALPRRTERSALPAALGASAVLTFTAVPLALAFPAPVWPDALGAFHAAPGLDASAVWAAEQLRAGLDARVPAWGALRLIPLAGCALLAFAALLAARDRRVSPPATPR